MADVCGTKGRNKIPHTLERHWSHSHVVLLLIGIVTGVISIARGTDQLGLFVVLLVSAAFLIILSSYNKDTKDTKTIVFLAFALRAGLALTHAYLVPLPDSDADALTFERLGWQAAEAWLGRGERPALRGAYLYSAWIGAIYYLVGRIPLVAQFTNVLLGTLTVYVTYRLSLIITEAPRPALIAALATALFPTLNLYSAITMRESFIVFLTALSVYCFFRWLRTCHLTQMLWAVVLLAAAALLHDGMIVIGIVYMFFFCFYQPKVKKWSLLSYNSVFALALLILTAVAFQAFLRDKLPENMSLILHPEYLAQRASVAARSRAAYLPNLIPTSPGDIILQTPLRILYFLYTPFPWMVSSLVDFVGLFDAVLYVFFSLYSLKGLAWLRKRSGVMFWAITLILIVFLGTFAWGTSNYGTAIRHRQKIVWLMTVPAGIGLAQSPWWRWPYRKKRFVDNMLGVQNKK